MHDTRSNATLMENVTQLNRKCNFMLETSPPALTEDLGSVSQISMVTQSIVVKILTVFSMDFHGDTIVKKSIKYLQCLAPKCTEDTPASSHGEDWVTGPSLTYIGYCQACWDNDLFSIQSEWIKDIRFPQSPLFKWAKHSQNKRSLSRDEK